MNRLAELTEKNALLAAAWNELSGPGITDATAAALVDVRVSGTEFAEFLTLATRAAPDANVFGLALSLAEYIDRRQAGHEALDHCLRSGTLTAHQLYFVRSTLTELTTPEAVNWSHTQLLTCRDDPMYYRFLKNHLTFTLANLHDEMTAYLLSPNRGPGMNNIFSFDLCIRNVPEPGPFLRRWHEWVWDGYFDEPKRVDSEYATLLYEHLSDRWEHPRFSSLQETVCARLVALLKIHAPARRANALHHLDAMINARYRGAPTIARQLMDNDIPQRDVDYHRRLSCLAQVTSR
jgi:hypothetical protein